MPVPRGTAHSASTHFPAHSFDSFDMLHQKMEATAELKALSKIERRRLYPRITNPNFLVLRSRRIIFQSWINSIKGNNLRILDIGGRYQPYRSLFGNRVGKYVACDILKTELVDVIGSGEAPAWYSPPLLDRIRDSSRSTVLTEPLACDAGGQYGGPRDGDSAAPLAGRPTDAVT